jgi:hypothetical protein
MKRVIENPKSDADLPLAVRQEIDELVKAGWLREVLLITEDGNVIIDPELISYDNDMQARYPGRPRSEYMTVEYPARIYVDE